ncbi:MAG: hypothetical protein H0W24_10775, partial [Lysobacter sp.]|nr:hypothetical protein [Lysobacter sp.]
MKGRLTHVTGLSSCYRRAIARCLISILEERTMTFNKALIALAMGFALAACSNQQQADESAADAAESASEAATAAAGTGDAAAQAAA